MSVASARSSVKCLADPGVLLLGQVDDIQFLGHEVAHFHTVDGRPLMRYERSAWVPGIGATIPSRTNCSWATAQGECRFPVSAR